MKNVLVTGVSGFVGSAMSRRLLSEGWHVRGTIRSACSGGIHPDVEAVSVPMMNGETDWSMALAGIDAVVHLAARVHVMKDDAADPLAAFREVNVAGTERLARSAAEAGVKRFVFLSSVKVNGEGRVTPYTEDDCPAPEDPYGISKWEAEEALRRVGRESSLEIVILRPPLVYGPGVKANFLRLLGLIDRGLPLPFGLVDNRRSLIYLGNLVDAIVTSIGHEKAVNKTYLVSDGEDLSTPELIRRIAYALEVRARLVPFPLSLMRLAGKLAGKSDEVERLLGSLTVNISAIRRELGWSPPFSVHDGLSDTAKWYRLSKERRTGS